MPVVESQPKREKKNYAVSIFQYSQDSCGHAGLNKRDSVIAKLSSEVRMQVEISIEYLSLLAFAKGKQGLYDYDSVKSNINSVGKPEQNLHKFQNSRTIDNQRVSICSWTFLSTADRLLTAKTIFDKGLLFKYLRIAGFQLVSEKLTSVVASSVFVDYNQ